MRITHQVEWHDAVVIECVKIGWFTTTFKIKIANDPPFYRKFVKGTIQNCSVKVKGEWP